MADNYWTHVSSVRRPRRRILGGAGLVAAGTASLALVGCGDDDSDTGSGGEATSPAGTTAATSQPKQGGTLSWAFPGQPHLDIQQITVHPLDVLTSQIYNRLLRYKDDEQLPEPDLAEAMPEQPDDLTFIFPITPGVKFHDKPPANGRVLVAADVAFSINRARTDDPMFVHKGDLANVDVVEAVDDQHLRITMKSPDAVILTTLAGYQFVVMAPEVIDQYGDARGADGTVGTGPFLIRRFSSDQHIEVERHPEYWRTGMPYLDKIVQLNVQDEWSQFLAGNIQDSTLAAQELLGSSTFEEALEKTGLDAYTYKTVSTSASHMHSMNRGRAAFQDGRVRLALHLLADRKPLRDYVYPIGGYPSIALGDGHAPFNLPESEYEDMPGFRLDKTQDVKDALALLAEAGYTREKPLSWEMMAWSLPNRSIGIDQLQLGAELYKEISGGVLQPTVKGLEFGSWKAAEANYEFDMTASGYAMGVDPHDVFAKIYASTGARNFAQFKDETFDRMLADERGTFELEERQDKVRDLLRYVNHPDRVAYVWNGTGPARNASLSKIQGRPALFDYGKVDRLYYT